MTETDSSLRNVVCFGQGQTMYNVQKVRHFNSQSSLLRNIHFNIRSRCSSDSIVYGYGLDDRATEVRSLAEAKDFISSLCVQTGCGAHRLLYNGNRGSFPGAKRGRGVTLITHCHLVPWSRTSRSYTSSPPKRHHGV
jgi:hypothetical protein